VRSLLLGDNEAEDFSWAWETEDSRLVVTFPRQSGSHELQVVFDAAILRYETVFSGRLLDSQGDDLPQEVEAAEEGALSVRVPLERQAVVHRVGVTPNPFTPNGDGVNDQATISYDLLHLIEDVPVSLKVYDLGGNEVRELLANSKQSGRYLVNWNGRNAQGAQLPPGLYILQVEVETDSGTQSRSSTVAIIY